MNTRLLLTALCALLRLAAAADAPAQPKSLEGHETEVSAVTFSADSKFIYSGDEQGNLFAWDIAKMEKAWTVHMHSGRIYDIAASHGGRIATAGNDYTIGVCDEKGGDVAHFDGHNERVYAVRFSPDGKTLVSASKDQTLRTWEFPTGVAQKTFEGHEDQVRGVEFLPTDAGKIVSLDRSGVLRLWDVKTAKQEALMQGGHTDRVYGLAVSPDGKTIATAGKDKLVILWDVATHAKRKELTEHKTKVGSVRFSPDGKTLASAGADGVVILWDSEGTRKGELTGCTVNIEDIAFSPDGKWLAAATADKTVRVWPLGN